MAFDNSDFLGINTLKITNKMILFIHGTGATNSLWLPHIRAIFGSQLDRLDATDSDLMEAFTITLPGHPSRDSWFDHEDIIDKIETFAESKIQNQRHLATKLIRSKNPKLVETLVESKLTIIAHSVGGAIAILYTGKHPKKVSKLIVAGAGSRFCMPTVLAGVMSFNLFIKPRSLKNIRSMLPKISNLRQRVMWTMFAENTERKGFLSCLEIINKYRLQTWFRTLSVEQQKDLAKVKMIFVNGFFDHLNLVSSTNSAYKLFNDNFIKYSNSQEIKPRVEKEIIKTAGHNVIDHPRFIRSLDKWLFE